jgi:hypothetical protein
MSEIFWFPVKIKQCQYSVLTLQLQGTGKFYTVTLSFPIPVFDLSPFAATYYSVLSENLFSLTAPIISLNSLSSTPVVPFFPFHLPVSQCALLCTMFQDKKA